MQHRNKHCFLWLMLMSAPSMAVAGASDFQLANVLQQLIDLLSSTLARLLFTLAIIGVGYAWLYLGTMPRARAIGAIVGIGLVFSSTYIANLLLR